MIGNVIQAKFLESLDYPTAASLSFILMATILVALLVYAKIVGHGEADRMKHCGARTWQVREAPLADRVRDRRLGYLMLADRRRDPLLVQRAQGSLQLRLAEGSRSTTGSTGTRCSGSRTR